jgi:hypothetical protein
MKIRSAEGPKNLQKNQKKHKTQKPKKKEKTLFFGFLADTPTEWKS